MEEAVVVVPAVGATAVVAAPAVMVAAGLVWAMVVALPPPASRYTGVRRP
jgi:hypothetical protein